MAQISLNVGDYFVGTSTSPEPQEKFGYVGLLLLPIIGYEPAQNSLGGNVNILSHTLLTIVKIVFIMIFNVILILFLPIVR